MRREIEDVLTVWRDRGPSAPMVIEGVRGCGKTHTVRRFASASADSVYFDVRSDGLEHIFSEGHHHRVLSELGAIGGTRIDDGTLIVLDGIQGIPGIDGFLEGMRRIHPKVLCTCTGTYPGAVRMEPMSFREYLRASGMDSLATALARDPLSEEVRSNHGKLSSMMREFWAVGGLPAAVREWMDSGDERSVDREIRRVMDSIRRDSAVSIPDDSDAASDVLGSIPEQLSGRNRKFMFGRAVPGARSRTLMRAVDWLESQCVVGRVQITTEASGPKGEQSPPNYKLYMFDTGVLRVASGIPVGLMASDMRPVQDSYGGFVENLVYLELSKSGIRDPFCWRSGNKAEVAFVFGSDGCNVPVQVSSGRMAFTRSLAEYRRRCDPGCSFFLSQTPPSVDTGMVRLPFYASGSLASVAEGIIQKS